MAQPHPAQAQRARDLVVQLGQLLADITAGRPTAAVHQHLLDKFDAAVHDYRIDAMEVGRQEFAATWDALRQGLALPATAWEQVVLPTVVGFSNTQKLKIHLELATSYWLAARAAVDAVPDYPAAVAALATVAATGPGERPVLASRPAAQVRPPTADAVAAVGRPPVGARPAPDGPGPAGIGRDRGRRAGHRHRHAGAGHPARRQRPAGIDERRTALPDARRPA